MYGNRTPQCEIHHSKVPVNTHSMRPVAINDPVALCVCRCVCHEQLRSYLYWKLFEAQGTLY